MRIILVRHATAEERDETRWPDPERPLSDRGRQRFFAVARGLGAVAGGVDLVLSSPYTRTWQTARLLHELAEWPTPEACDALIEADPTALGVIVTARAEAAARIAFIGHEPGMSGLTAWLLGAPADSAALAFRKGGAACLELAEWGPGHAVLQWFAPPKLLRR